MKKSNNQSHLTITLNKEVRELYDALAKSLQMPTSTLIRLLLVAQMGKVEPLANLIKTKLDLIEELNNAKQN